MNDYEVIKKPLVTEKAMSAQASGSLYVFAVDRRADKNAISRAEFRKPPAPAAPAAPAAPTAPEQKS